MIKACDSKCDLEFMKPDPFSVKISALFDTYGTSFNFARFYFQTTDNVPSAAFSIIDGNVTAYIENFADFSEISDFLSFIGYASIQCHCDVLNKLGIIPDNSSYIVRYNRKVHSAPENFSSDFVPSEIYNLLTSCGFELGDYSSFLADICTRLNKGTGSFGCISITGRPVSCAFRLFEADIGILLGAVATLPEFRRNGYSTHILQYLASDSKPTFLLTRNDGLLDFYIKSGFVPVGRWASA